MAMPQRRVEVEVHYLAVVSMARRDACQGVYRSVDPDQDIYQHAHRQARREMTVNGGRAEKPTNQPPPRLGQSTSGSDSNSGTSAM